MFHDFLNFTLWILMTSGHVICYITNAVKTEDESSTDRIGVSGKWMIDNAGRVRLFHGINQVQKSFPWYPADMLNQTKLKYYQQWGFNAVRLGVMWSGVQPKEDVTNTTYVKIIQDIVTTLKDHGMYSLLDMHQDVMSSAYHAYDGVPLWLVKKFPPPRHPFPWPLQRISQWAEGYLAEATGEAFQHLYKNTSRALDYMSDFWTHVAKAFWNETSVLGYEIINEPWAGDIYADLSLLLPGRTGEVNLLPMYDIINTAIRKVDTQTLLFYEPVTWGVYFNGKYMGSGFPRVPGGQQYQNLSVLSYHYYCWILTSDDAGQSYPFFKKIICDDLLKPRAFTHALDDIKKTGGSSFLTEFGAFNIEGLNHTSAQEDRRVMSLADEHLQSWMYWDSDFFTQDGNIRWDTVKLFSRPYARAIAGIPRHINYDIDNKSFSLTFDQNPSITAPTEIFVPSFQYPNGPTVSVSSGFSASFNSTSSIVFIKYKANRSSSTASCHVAIQPK